MCSCFGLSYEESTWRPSAGTSTQVAINDFSPSFAAPQLACACSAAAAPRPSDSGNCASNHRDHSGQHIGRCRQSTWRPPVIDLTRPARRPRCDCPDSAPEKPDARLDDRALQILLNGGGGLLVRRTICAGMQHRMPRARGARAVPSEAFRPSAAAVGTRSGAPENRPSPAGPSATTFLP